MFKVWNDLVENCVQPIKDPKTGLPTGQEVATLSCIPAIFANLLSALLAFAGLTALLMFLVGSFKIMNSSGDPKQITGADNNFKYGIIGLSIVLASFLLINVISQITGVECITKFGFGCK